MFPVMNTLFYLSVYYLSGSPRVCPRVCRWVCPSVPDFPCQACLAITTTTKKKKKGFAENEKLLKKRLSWVEKR